MHIVQYILYTVCNIQIYLQYVDILSFFLKTMLTVCVSRVSQTPNEQTAGGPHFESIVS